MYVPCALPVLNYKSGICRELGGVAHYKTDLLQAAQERNGKPPLRGERGAVELVQ